MTKVKIMRPYQRVSHPKVFYRPTLTKQAMKSECDVNSIMAKYRQTGVLPHTSALRPRYDDVSNATNYHDAINTVMEADNAFADLPAAIRRHFDNDPAKLMEALADPAQRDELVDLGIIEGPETDASSLAPDSGPTDSPQGDPPEKGGENGT